jgi:hypothetical protein
MKITCTLAVLLACASAHADWEHATRTDKMTSKTVYFAGITSSNSLSLGFPYSGANYGQLTIRKRTSDGTTVTLKVDKGQIQCSSYSGCPIHVRFDDAPLVKFSGTEPADNSSDAVFFNNEKRFIELASKAKRILVQVNMFKNGSQILEFQTSKPLEWKPGK